MEDILKNVCRLFILLKCVKAFAIFRYLYQILLFTLCEVHTLEFLKFRKGKKMNYEISNRYFSADSLLFFPAFLKLIQGYLVRFTYQKNNFV